MKTILLCIIIASILKPSPKLIGTVWVHRVAKGCIDTLKLSNEKVIEYDCEMSYSFKGSYSQSRDTLIITVKDDYHSEDGGKADYYISKYLIRKNSLYILGTERLIDGKGKYDDKKLDGLTWYKKLK